MKNICIIGSGSWGCAIGIHLAKMGHNVKMWAHSQEESDNINDNRATKYLPNVKLPDNIFCTTDYKEAIDGTEFIFHVTPSRFTRENLVKYKEYVTDQPIVICSKGFEAETLSTLSDVVNDELPNTKVAILSGPSHAEEVSTGIPTAIVIASQYIDVLYNLQDLLMNETLRVYTSTDVKGVELGGALKNIIAFCAGVAAELQLGDNSFAALLTRGLNEISRLGVAMGGNHNTFFGLSGLGDLIVTCLSEHSRNRRAGKCIGRGLTVEETRQEIGMVVESFDNIEVAYKLSKKYNIDMPIVNTVYDVLYNNLNPKDAVTLLMTREKKSE